MLASRESISEDSITFICIFYFLQDVQNGKAMFSIYHYVLTQSKRACLAFYIYVNMGKTPVDSLQDMKCMT